MYRIIQNHNGEYMVQGKGWFLWRYFGGARFAATWDTEEEALKFIEERKHEDKAERFQIVKQENSYHVRKKWLLFWKNVDITFATAEEAEYYIDQELEKL